MSHHRTTVRTGLAVGVALLIAAAPAGAMPAKDYGLNGATGDVATPTKSQDLRSPDARYAGIPTTPAQDLRSPDARYAGIPTTPAQDLRSPDARDVGTRLPVVHDTVAAPARVIETSARGFDWGDAAIGAAGVVALGLLVVAGTAGIGRRRRVHAS